MSEIDPQSSLPETPEEAAQSGTLIASIALKQRAGGIAIPAATVVIAFLMGGLGAEADRAHLVAERRPVEDEVEDDESGERDEEADVQPLQLLLSPEDGELG